MTGEKKLHIKLRCKNVGDGGKGSYEEAGGVKKKVLRVQYICLNDCDLLYEPESGCVYTFDKPHRKLGVLGVDYLSPDYDCESEESTLLTPGSPCL